MLFTDHEKQLILVGLALLSQKRKLHNPDLTMELYRSVENLPVVDEDSEDCIEIQTMIHALRGYGAANRIDEDNMGDFIEAAFEAIDNGPIDQYATTDEDLVHEAQQEIIVELYGKNVKYNAGWFVDSDDLTTTVSSKVYVTGRPVLSSTIDHATKEITHLWE